MRIERLRVWLLASAALLVVVIVGFIGTARYLRRHWMASIPGKLGANVRVDTSGITYSHTYRGETDYVIHAAKDLQHTDGTYALHDVWMKVCGRQQRRADMVRGDDWEWDPKSGVIRAHGVVHIELRAALDKPGCTAVDDAAAGEAGAKDLRVTTSDLVYMQSLGVAATRAPVEFESGAMQGHAVGADYASDTGTLMLDSAVSMAGMQAGRAVGLNAASAEMDTQERVVRLSGARYVTGAGAAARTATADGAVLHLRADQTLERIEAQGDVTMQGGGGTVSSAKANVTMNAAGHPVNALLTGGVQYAADGPLSQRRGEAQQATIEFDGKASPQAQHAVLTGAAHVVEKTRADAAKTAWSVRELTAAKLDVALAPDAAGKNEVRDAEARGAARFSEVNPATGASAKGGSAATTTEIAGDDLKAHFAAARVGAGSAPELETMDGRGHTLVRQVNAAGVEQTSAGDVLDVRFRPGRAAAVNGRRAPSSAAADRMNADAVASAVQTGHVVVTRKDPAKGVKGGRIEEARAQQASYDGDTDRMTLNGGVQLTDVDGQLWASEVVMEHATGDAHAAGGVRVEYRSQQNMGAERNAAQADEEPTHVLAQRAELDHATDTVTFHGAPARMWQGGSQVQAAVIEMDRAAKRLIARGESATGQSGAGDDGGAAQVHTVLMSAGGANGGSARGGPRPAQACAADAGAAKTGAGAQPQVVRVASGGLVYSQALDEAEFTGGFRAVAGDGTEETVIRAGAGTVYLKDKKGGGKSSSDTASVPMMAGNVDSVVANGQVTVEWPGWNATGERLVYTAADKAAVLTGDESHPPKAVDGQGTITTGAALEFRRGCGRTGDTVEALGSAPGAPAGQVHTESRMDARQGRTH